MPDRRRHRGPHPGDEQRFGAGAMAVLATAIEDLSWLQGRGYARDAALALVGDRYQLDARQRIAVQRSACSDAARASRESRRVAARDLRGRTLWIDGFNVLTTVEAALAGGVLLHCRDGCTRDMASMHGSWRRVDETLPALVRIGETLEGLGLQHAEWLFDRPVSNSGRIAALAREVAATHGWDWAASVTDNPDRDLIDARDVVVASVDSQVLDHCAAWFDLATASIPKGVKSDPA